MRNDLIKNNQYWILIFMQIVKNNLICTPIALSSTYFHQFAQQLPSSSHALFSLFGANMTAGSSNRRIHFCSFGYGLICAISNWPNIGIWLDERTLYTNRKCSFPSWDRREDGGKLAFYSKCMIHTFEIEWFFFFWVNTAEGNQYTMSRVSIESKLLFSHLLRCPRKPFGGSIIPTLM